MITIKPYGGLGNRLRVLYSAFTLNAQLGDRVKIIWDQAKGLNCPFEELFVTPANCKVKNIRQGFYRKMKKYALIKLNIPNVYKLKHDVIIDDKRAKELRKDNSRLIEECKGKSVYIETCYDFYVNEKNIDFLKPIEAIRLRVENISKNFDSNTYGIHIRSTDKISSKKFSPTSVFKKQIREIIDTDETARFFLTADAKEVEKDFVNQFQDKIITSGEKVLDRNSPEGIKSALVDILCLSKTKKIYGSYGSSFSSVPGLFTGVECESVIIKMP